MTRPDNTERQKGLYAFFQTASIYRAFQAAVAPRRAIAYLQEVMAARSGDRVFDIGCGPGDVLEILPEVDYLGIDLSEDYIVAAKTRFKDRARFECVSAGRATVGDEAGTFDLCIAKGVVHHLDDKEAIQLFELARSALKPGGRLVTFDGCYTEDQSTLSRWVVSRDRGKFVRDVAAYRDLAAKVFDRVDVSVRHDLLRIPYTHLSMTCTA